MFAADRAPDWSDGDNCHRCRVQFSVMVRRVRINLLLFLLHESPSILCVNNHPETYFLILLYCYIGFYLLVASLPSLWPNFLWEMHYKVLHAAQVWN